MKLSVSAYRAHASAHKKILDTAYQLNYGSTSASSITTAGTGAGHHPYKVEPLGADDATTPLTAQSHSHLTTNPTNAENSGSDTPVNSPRSPLNTSRDEDDESSNAASSECKSPSQRYGGTSPGGLSSGHISRHGSRETSGGITPPKTGSNSLHGSIQSVAEATAKAATQSWKNIRAVMAYYHTLRKIKRTKSNQRWMKLRTTVQISSAIQKKPPLKREDSFLKRFSTRQLPDQQETIDDTNSESNAPGSQNQTAPRRRRRLQKHPRTVVNPDENFYFYWLLALTVCVLYNMWTLIVRQSFPELQQLISTFWYICDGVSDIVFLLDVGVQLRTGYLEQGLMVYDSKKLAGHYLSSRAFLLDLGALCPLDLLQVRFGPQPMLRFPRFLKVYRAVNYYYMVESRTVWPNLWRVVNLIHILLILAHWFGCFYFLLSEAEGFQGDWVYPYRPGDYATLTRKYLGSLYWSTLTLTTIGDLPTPETNAEKAVTVDGPKSIPRRGLKSRLLQFNTNGGYVFTIVSYLIGVFIFATIVGQVGNVITNRNANRLEFERLLDGAKTYMRHHKVPSGMKKRVLRWYDYSWSRGRIQGGGDINTALGLLPDKLKTELALHVNLSVLKKVTIFQECQPEFLHDLVLKMKAYIFTPGDSICRKGEVAREMFIIADGILEVLSETGRVLTTMKAGDFFGEIGILNLDGLNKRTADVRSVGYSELFSLSREDVLAAMKDYPEAQEILQALGRKRLMEVRNSARQSQKISSKHHRSTHREADSHAGGGDGQSETPATRNLVNKIKSEAKGLRNALRKSRAYRQKSDESLELQPLHTPSKGVLKRMPRVRSDEMSQEDPDPGGGDDNRGVGITSPLGAGLPLLSRLRLLKEKQDNEERASICHSSGVGPLASPSSIVQSPPPVPEVDEPPSEVIGAGLPLLQRLLLLKAKEDREKINICKVTSSSGSGGSASASASASVVNSGHSVGASAGGSVPAQTVTGRSKSPSPALSPKPTTGKVSFRDRLFAVRSAVNVPTPSVQETTKSDPVQLQKHQNIPEIKPSEQQQQQQQLNKSETEQHIEEPPSASTPDVIKDTRDSSNIPRDSPVSSTGQKLPCIVGFVQKTNIGILETQSILDNSASKSVLEPVPETIPRNVLEQISASSTNSVDSDLSDPWSKLKQAAIVRDNSATQLAPPVFSTSPSTFSTTSDNLTPISSTAINSDSVCATKQRTKPGLLQLQSRTKYYESIDDLSPEYGGLPFVKKLKILNERQKLAELESAMKTRSVSLDIPENSTYDEQVLTRSQSEASAMHRKNSNHLRLHANHNDVPVSPNETNETPERRNLKSILKKLSEDVRTVPIADVREDDRSNFRQLMRAQTIEGYAARHTKLAKSVTFNRETLQSPPGSVTSPSIPQISPHTSSTFEFTTSPTIITQDREVTVETTGVQVGIGLSGSVFSTGVQTNIGQLGLASDVGVVQSGMVQIQTGLTVPCDNNGLIGLPTELSPLVERIEEESTENIEVKVVKSPLEEHEYFGEALLAIKQVISAHLQEMQQKFQQRFDRLEQEVKSRDMVIGQLRQHIHDLETSIDDSYTGSDSLSTVISRLDRHSWDDPSNTESLELQDLPESIRPHRAWSPSSPGGSPNSTNRTHNRSPNRLSPCNSDTVIDLDSATDTESELGDSDNQDLDFRDFHGLSHNNWEFEMLAAQMRQQRRSHSFDQNAHAHFSHHGHLGAQGAHQAGTRGSLARRRLLCRGYSADTSTRD